MTKAGAFNDDALDANRLYRWVESYAAFGNHHSGTEADWATTEWLSEELVSLGAAVRLDSYEFERYVVTSSLAGPDGASVPSLPLFYSALGEWQAAEVEVVELPLASVGAASGLEGQLDDHGGASALAIAIDGPDDLPVQCNRVPGEYLGRPAIVIPTNWTDRVRAGALLDFEARSETSASANIVATLGPSGAPPITVTTPLTGWTPAAGERGTGLAAALTIAEDLKADHHVTFVGCSGHELNHIGLRHHLANQFPESVPPTTPPSPTIHLGASMAAVEHTAEGAQLAGTRMVFTSAAGAVRDRLRARVADANWKLIDRDPPWPGEGGTWIERDVPVLSFVGSFPLFHTTADLIEQATTPEALLLATTVARDAARIFATSNG